MHDLDTITWSYTTNSSNKELNKHINIDDISYLPIATLVENDLDTYEPKQSLIMVKI